jgi:predicted O-methyltransferase YrrM
MLEIGVDRGVSFLTLATFLARSRQEFLAIGVDILVQEQVELMLQHIDRQPKQSAYLLSGNSLQVLPNMIDQGMKFDLVLLDGDHNYHTVANELVHIEKLLTDDGIIVVDDYAGRWSERDLWYTERPGYENVEIASKKVDTDKHGVKPAVDEWLSTRPAWKLSSPVSGEPVVLSRQPI